MNRITLASLATLGSLAISCSGGTSKAPDPVGATPSPQQVEWQKMEMNMFFHFGPNTFTGREWGLGNEAEDIFNPTDLDCRQWTSIAKAAGFKGVIVTAKHHDGFCLWPNPVCTHTVAQSPWRDGKGDVLKDLSEACCEDGIKFGIYISPWDRNDPTYGSPAYNDVYVKTLEDAHGRYGDIFEQWFDGANGEGPNGKRQVYDWKRFHEAVLSIHPEAIMFSDIGPGCRWVGNEKGIAGETSWSTLDTEGFGPGSDAPCRDTLTAGNVWGECWVPAETDVSIRPGWFWRESENDKVKTLDHLLDIYYSSVGRNSLLLLNVPPDTTGQIHPADSARLMEFKAALDEIFREDLSKGAKAKASAVRGRRFKAANVLDGSYDTYWAAPDGTCRASLTIELDGMKTFNRVMLQEYIPLGQRVKAFSVEAQGEDGSWTRIGEGTTIGYKRILLTEKVAAKAVRVNIEGSKACPVLNGFGLFLDTIKN